MTRSTPAFPMGGPLSAPRALAGRPPAPRPVAPAPAAGGAYGAAASRYRDAELSAATPAQLVVMLFDKMLLTLRRARVALEAGEVETRTELLLKASDMLTELRVTLDHEQGGDIARNLDALYGYALQQLFAVNRHREVARLDEVLRIVGELRDGFAGALAQLQGGGASAFPTARSA